MEHIIITGATNGLGKELAYLIHQFSDMKLYLIGRNITRVAHLTRKEYLYEVDFENMYSDKTIELFNVLENNAEESDQITFINCAGAITPIKLIKNISDQEIVKNLNINVVWPIKLIKEVVKIGEKNKCNIKIINVSSGVAHRPISGWSLYSTSKAAINTFLETLIKEKKTYRIVSIDPGVMDTNMQDEIRDTYKQASELTHLKQFVEFKEQNVLVSPTKVAKTIVKAYLAEWRAKGSYEKISIHYGE